MSIGHRGALFLAADPLLSSDGLMGHHGLYLADSIIQNGYASKVIITNIICGGNYCADWAAGGGQVLSGADLSSRPGELSYRIGLTARCINSVGLGSLKTVIDWQQGEFDTDGAGTPQSVYQAELQNVISQFKNWGLLRTGNRMLVHLCTRISGTTAARNAVRAAQAAVADNVLVFPGADIDTIDASKRWDGTHLNATGAQAQAALKLPMYQAYLGF
jgi:hypothetical protein